MKQFILLLIILCLHPFVDAQSLYEFEYHFVVDNVKEDYKALFIRNDDGTGIVRVTYEGDDKKQYLVEMQIQEHYDADEQGITDTNTLIVETYNPVILRGDNNGGYDPDYFWFKKNPAENIYEPWAVVSPDDSSFHEGVISNVRLIENKDLTEAFVLQYFNATENFYRNLFDPVLKNIPTEVTPLQSAAKMYLVLVANTIEASIKKTCIIDKDETLQAFQQIAEYLKIPFIPTIIADANYSKTSVQNALNSIRPSKNDIVIFYYSGHGYNKKDQYQYPYLDLRQKLYDQLDNSNTINIQEIYNQVKQKGARLNLVLSDCCNTLPEQTAGIIEETPSLRNSSLGWNIQNCSQLFLNNKPVSILMTAASKGEASAGNGSQGGYFTFNFRETLFKRLGLFYHFVSWDDLLNSAKKQTIAKANGAKCPKISGEGYEPCKQTPTFIME
ncbi:MAG: hypothetical protein RL172_598 [Bacteroidota bacterium]|jgi:hypothetical protein